MGNSLKPKIVCIVGPTASGKTSLSLELAQQFNGEVINADSRQVYKGLDIGTEKISAEEMQGIPHHLLDVVEVCEVYTVVDFKRDAEAAILDICSRGKLPIIAGGTFFYIDTLLGKMSTAPVPPNPELRMGFEKRSKEDLFLELQQKDPRRALEIDRHNKRRLIRALEITQELEAIPEQTLNAECPYDVLIIGIKVDKEVLRNRLRERAQKALTKGLIKETEDLLASGVTRERLFEVGLEYKVAIEYLDGALTNEGLIQKLQEKNWQYAKRQLVWLKRDTDIHWFERDDESITPLVEEFLQLQSR